MSETIVVELRLPADVAAAIRAREKTGLTEAEQVQVPLAIGLFADAERARVNYFITCDDDIVKNYKKYQNAIMVEVLSSLVRKFDDVFI